MPDDVDRLRAVLELCESRRILVAGVQVGDIRIQVVGRVPLEPPKPSIDGMVEVKTGPELEAEAREAKLVELRKRSKETFGYVKSDETLLALEGAL